MTIRPEEKISLNTLRKKFKEDSSPNVIQSSSGEEQRFLRHKPFFFPVVNYYGSATINHDNRPLLSILFRPVMKAWSAMVGATRTFFNTITMTHTTIEYVKETTSTTTLFACINNDVANNVILNELPKCLSTPEININPEPVSTTTIPITFDYDSSTAASNHIASLTPPIILSATNSSAPPESLNETLTDVTLLEETIENENTTDAITMNEGSIN